MAGEDQNMAALKLATSKKAQEAAFRKAKMEIVSTVAGEVTEDASRLLVSKNGNRLASELFDKFVKASEEYPMDVVASSALQFAINQYAGYYAFLNLNTAAKRASRIPGIPLVKHRQ
jgi:hypothetical protein